MYGHLILQLNSRQKSDILITISSSGKSQNIINAIRVAKKKSITTISLTGFDGGISKKIADIKIETFNHNTLFGKFYSNKNYAAA